MNNLWRMQQCRNGCNCPPPRLNGGLSPQNGALEPNTPPYSPLVLGKCTSQALLDRVESKYLLHASTLLDALATLRNEYAVLECDGQQA